MSLLKEIEYRKKCLKSCETKVTTPEGHVYREQKLSDGSLRVSRDEHTNNLGFVVDTQPDLEIAHVLPGVYMGSQDVTQDLELLNQHNITHVLSVGILVPKVSENIIYKYVPLLDVPESDLITLLEECISYVNIARKNGCVFVHCNAGISRSASVVIAYLMSTGMNYDEAFSHLRNQRSVIKPNEGFVHQLRMFEKQLQSL